MAIYNDLLDLNGWIHEINKRQVSENVREAGRNIFFFSLYPVEFRSEFGPFFFQIINAFGKAFDLCIDGSLSVIDLVQRGRQVVHLLLCFRQILAQVFCLRVFRTIRYRFFSVIAFRFVLGFLKTELLIRAVPHTLHLFLLIQSLLIILLLLLLARCCGLQVRIDLRIFRICTNRFQL